jgi:hypothetical protein
VSFAQNGEDLIVWHALHGLGITRPRYLDIGAHHPGVSAILTPRPYAIRALQAARVQLRYPGYTRIRDRRRPSALRHQIALMAAELGLTGEISLAPEIHLRPVERAVGEIGTSQIAIQSSALSARYPTPNKQWPVERMAEVARQLAVHHTVVQLGGPADPLLPDVVDCRGIADLRHVAAIMASSRAFVGLEGFLAHLARAVQCWAVIVYGGYSAPDETGYPCNENLFTNVPCAPCWEPTRCDYARRCLTAIEPAHILAAVARVLQRVGTPLETTVVDLDIIRIMSV